MACRCVVHFAKSAQDKGNHKTFPLRLIAVFNQDQNVVKIKLGSGGNFFVHYKAAAMPEDHIDLVEKLGGKLKATHQADYHFYTQLPDPRETELRLAS